MFKKSFRGEIFFYYIVVFVIFTVAILTFQFQREKSYRASQLENTLDNITEITHRYINQNNLIERNELDEIGELNTIIPQPNTRITVIGRNGNVLYDSFVEEYNEMENHLMRPEVQKALNSGTGSNIRRSETTKQEYYYYAKKYPDYFVRTAVVYNVELKNFLKAERLFIVFIIGIFVLIGIILYFVTRRLALAITKLQDFAVKAGRNELFDTNTKFPENELGIISSQIINIYNDLKNARDELFNEKEKLFNHLNALNEGIAFFSPKKVKTLSNSHFVQYINIISKKPVNTFREIFKLKEFKKLNNFLNDYLKSGKVIEVDSLPQFETVISKGEKYFKVQSIIFVDRSFEIVVTDITRLEKRRLMKQQLTSNIAHELKTPLSSIKGYLETILDNWPLPEEKHKYFLDKAYSQSERLTDLINDVSLLNNIEDAGELFKFETLNVSKVVQEVYENLANRIQEKQIRITQQLPADVTISGNESLLFSVFQNFFENSINYGGRNIEIVVQIFHEDEKFYYFSYSDTGPGIPDKHLPRIFERFYRVDHGRTREMGGTGLGLAIVKNAIQLHGGEISVRNKPKDGTEFLFSLAKK